MHIGELGLLEVGGDPDVLQRHEVEALARLDDLAHLDDLPGHDAVHGRREVV